MGKSRITIGSQGLADLHPHYSDYKSVPTEANVSLFVAGSNPLF
jgi:hypothetical protein